MAYVRLEVTSPPAVPVVPTELARRHCRIDNDDEMFLLNLYLNSATSMIESYLNRALITQTLRWTISQTFPPISWPVIQAPLVVLPLSITWDLMKSWMQAVEIPRSPIQSITSVINGNWDGADTPLVLGTDYDVDITNTPARIRFITTQAWGINDHIQIVYTAGYGDTPASVPVPIQHAILLATAHFYEMRGDTDEGGLPSAVYRLCDPYRMWYQPT